MADKTTVDCKRTDEKGAKERNRIVKLPAQRAGLAGTFRSNQEGVHE
jgi:hypothetical protein